MSQTKKLAVLIAVKIKLNSIETGLDKLISANKAHELETLNFLKTLK